MSNFHFPNCQVKSIKILIQNIKILNSIFQKCYFLKNIPRAQNGCKRNYGMLWDSLDPPKKPKLIVFDCDYTLWPFQADIHVRPPFRQTDDDLIDVYGVRVRVYRETPEVLKWCYKNGFLMGVVTSTERVYGVQQLITALGWAHYFQYREMCIGSKHSHITSIKGMSGIDYADMLFFDDEQSNVEAVSALGVVSQRVNHGIDMRTLSQGLDKYDTVRRASAKK